jgi:hypothetical protein
MLDYTNYNYREKPFTRSNKFGVHPLSQTGQHEYVCRDSQVHWFMHKIPPRLLQELYAPQTEDCDQEQHGCYMKGSTFQEFDSEKLNPPCAEDQEAVQENETDFNNYSKTLELPNQYNFVQYCSNKPTPTLFRKSGYSMQRSQKLKDSRFANDYVNEAELLKTNARFTATSTDWKRKKYDGFTSYQVPRTEPEYKEEFRKSRLVTDRIYNSVYNPCVQNQDINEENERLKAIYLNQTNRNFLKSNKLPQISLIVNQPKTLLKNTNTSSTKMMGGKYNPFNYHGTSKNWTKRNYLGALYQH